MVLQKHGLHVETTEKSDFISPYEDIIENGCLRMRIKVEEKPRVRAQRKDAQINRKTLDRITLECALAFAELTPSEVHHGETLNSIRMTVLLLLSSMGYENYRHLCMSSKPGWTSYADWEKVARAECLSNAEIDYMRAKAKSDDPTNYEESPPQAS